MNALLASLLIACHIEELDFNVGKIHEGTKRQNGIQEKAIAGPLATFNLES